MKLTKKLWKDNWLVGIVQCPSCRGNIASHVVFDDKAGEAVTSLRNQSDSDSLRMIQATCVIAGFT